MKNNLWRTAILVRLALPLPHLRVHPRVLPCRRVRVRVFSQGFGVAASLDTTLVLSSICVEDEATGQEMVA